MYTHNYIRACYSLYSIPSANVSLYTLMCLIMHVMRI